MNYNDERDFSSYETDEERYGLNNGGFVKISNNENQNEHQLKNQKIRKRKGPGPAYFVCLWIAFLVSALGISMSIFTSASRSKLHQEIESAVVNFSMTVEKVSGTDGLGLIPMKDSELTTAIAGPAEEKCKDASGSTVCQIYKVTVQNDSDYGVYFKSSLELIASQNSNYKNLKWVEITNGNTPFVFGQPKLMSTTDWKPSYGIGANTSMDFYIAIWISDNGQVQNYSDFGNFTGNVTFEALSGDKITSTFSAR